ncbi:MAG: hypothetical protein EZS28_040562 [Streblomastix strix]|uniref:SPRY domain-containing protein n=1 Tax=Streblomastix strix TaxID=222440 RepID=A0A5J4U1P6_9EUKA|nr:MAG: hypothetical protein EZS28_040562 [Streblomastix strix]
MFFGNSRDAGIGIVQDSFNINIDSHPFDNPNSQHMATYGGAQYDGGPGCVIYKGSQTPGNSVYTDGQIVKMEFNSEKGTLIFFVDGNQQPIFISGIKDKVKFVLGMCGTNRYCTVRSLKKLIVPQAQQVSNAKSIQW